LPEINAFLQGSRHQAIALRIAITPVITSAVDGLFKIPVRERQATARRVLCRGGEIFQRLIVRVSDVKYDAVDDVVGGRRPSGAVGVLAIIFYRLLGLRHVGESQPE